MGVIDLITPNLTQWITLNLVVLIAIGNIKNQNKNIKNYMPTNYTNIQQKISSGVQSELENVNYVYPGNALKEHSEEYIYYKTDHHQTTLGSYYSYLEYCRAADISPVSYKEKIRRRDIV